MIKYSFPLVYSKVWKYDAFNCLLIPIILHEKYYYCNLFLIYFENDPFIPWGSFTALMSSINFTVDVQWCQMPLTRNEPQRSDLVEEPESMGLGWCADGSFSIRAECSSNPLSCARLSCTLRWKLGNQALEGPLREREVMMQIWGYPSHLTASNVICLLNLPADNPQICTWFLALALCWIHRPSCLADITWMTMRHLRLHVSKSELLPFLLEAPTS